ncbi:MAG: hypothetical protein AAF662_03565 [Pseudomonadota bacterium]
MVGRREQGFVLASTVWLTTILLILGAVFHSYVQARVEQAIRLQGHGRAEFDLYSTGQSVRYLLLTRHLTRAGLSSGARHPSSLVGADGFAVREPFGDEIRVDGTAYSGIGCARYRIQDRSGLVALNAEGTDRLLAQGFSWRLSEPAMGSLSAALADYRDRDSERRLGGAEISDYRRLGMQAPRDSYLRSDRELAAVMGWADWLAQAPERSAWFDIGNGAAFNLNASPPGLLALLLGVGPDEAQELVDTRTREPFESLDQVSAALNRLNHWKEERFRFTAGRGFRVELWCNAGNRIRVRGIQLTPQGIDGPAQTDYYYRASRSGDDGYVEESPSGARALFTDTLPADSG